MIALQTWIVEQWHWAQAHPLIAISTAYAVLNGLCLWGVKKLPPGSKWWHLCMAILQTITNLAGLANNIMGMLGKAPIIKIEQAPPIGIVTDGSQATNIGTPDRTALKGIAIFFALVSFLHLRVSDAYANRFEVGKTFTLVEWRLRGPSFEPAGGITAQYHWTKWDLGIMLTAGGSFLKNSATANISAAPFACLGESFGWGHGTCLGAKFDLIGGLGGALKNFTWANCFGIVFNLGPDLLRLMDALTMAFLNTYA